MIRSRKPREKKEDTPLGKKHARVLKIVTAINAVMFVVEAVCGGWFAHSTALIADSADMLGDALGAGTGLMVRKSSPRKQAWVALAKAGFMCALGLSVLAGAALLLANPVVMPVAATMAIVGGLALAANTTCAALLWRYRNDNINIKATLICTRNDMVSNVGVLAAAGLARLLVSPIPDIVVGIAVSGLFITSSVKIAHASIKVLRAPENARKKKPAASAPSSRPQPKIVSGFKKAVRTVFNRKAAAPEKVPVAAPQEPVEQKPVAQEPPAQTPTVNKPDEKQAPAKNNLPASNPCTSLTGN